MAKLHEDCLAADDNKSIRTGNACGSANVCSSCGRRMGAEARFYCANFLGVQYAHKRRILTKALSVVGFRRQNRRDLRHRMREPVAPFGIGSKQRRSIVILP